MHCFQNMEHPFNEVKTWNTGVRPNNFMKSSQKFIFFVLNSAYEYSKIKKNLHSWDAARIPYMNKFCNRLYDMGIVCFMQWYCQE